MLVPAPLALAAGEGNIISPNGSLLVVLALFLLFVFILNRILFRPISRVLDERDALTNGAANEARAASRSYEMRLAEYEATIRQARGESYRTLEQERAAALEQRRQVVEAAKGDAAAEIAQARSVVAEQAAAARTALEAESRQLAEQISRTLLGRAVRGGTE